MTVDLFRSMCHSAVSGALLLAVLAVGCQSSAERARAEMQSVHRSAIALNEQMKSGASLEGLRKLRANLATELAIVHGRMQAEPSVERLLRQHYAAYQIAWQSYSLVIDILEHQHAFERCVAPRHAPADMAHFKAMLHEEQVAEYGASAEFADRYWKCVKQFWGLDHPLHQRADQLGMKCPEWRPGCLAKFAEAKLTIAQDLLMKP